LLFCAGQVCITLLATWQACVQREIDYGEYFEHAMKMQMLKPSNKCVFQRIPPNMLPRSLLPRNRRLGETIPQTITSQHIIN
jgi:hypothetical protein